MQGSIGLKSINDLQASFYKLVNTHLIIQSTSTDKQQQIEFDNTSGYSDIKHLLFPYSQTSERNRTQTMLPVTSFNNLFSFHPVHF